MLNNDSEKFYLLRRINKFDIENSKFITFYNILNTKKKLKINKSEFIKDIDTNINLFLEGKIEYNSILKICNLENELNSENSFNNSYDLLSNHNQIWVITEHNSDDNKINNNNNKLQNVEDELIHNIDENLFDINYDEKKKKYN